MIKKHIDTKYGKIINYVDLDESQICIEDIVHSLSLENRYMNMSRFPYTVANHSINCALVLKEEGYDKDQILHALMHDASEAYLHDLPTPLKNLLPDYRIIESKFETAMASVFGIPSEKTKLINLLDEYILRLEKETFFNENFQNDSIFQFRPKIEIKSYDTTRKKFMEIYESCK